MKSWVQFPVCCIVAAGFWLIHNLSQSYAEVVSVPVVAESNIEGRTRVSSSEATITARVRTTGFHLASLMRGQRRPVTVVFSPEDFHHVSGDIYSIPATKLEKYGSAVFGTVESVESFLIESAEFTFPAATHRKVPVRQVSEVSFEPQYTATAPMRMKPDSVTLYGELSRLENISYVLTKPLTLKDLRSSAHGTVKLDIAEGIRSSATEVNYSLEVSRYVEVSAEVSMTARNVPAGSELAVIPSVASVVFRCVFPMSEDPVASSRFYIDYRDFASSLTGRCVAHCDNLPSGVIDYTVDPEIFDCFLRSE